MTSPLSSSPKTPPTNLVANGFNTPSENNRTQIVHGKKLEFEFTKVSDFEGSDHDIWVQQIEGKQGYFRVTSPSKPYTNTPLKLLDAEALIKSYEQGYKAQGFKFEKTKPKSAAE